MLKWKNKLFRPNSFGEEPVKNKQDKLENNTKTVNSIFKFGTFRKNPIKVTAVKDRNFYSEMNTNKMEASNGFNRTGGDGAVLNEEERIYDRLSNNILDHSKSSLPPDPNTSDLQLTENPIYDSLSQSFTISSSSASEYHDVVGSCPPPPNTDKVDKISQDIGEISLGNDSPAVIKNTDTTALYESINIKAYDNNFDDENKDPDLLTNNKMNCEAPVEKDYLSRRNLLNSNLMDNEYEEVYIPEPDYDVDEVTLSFRNEDSGCTESSRSSPVRVFKSYDGEDFGLYLSDDEDLSDINGYTWRKDIQYQSANNAPKKASTEIKRNRPKGQKISPRLFKSAPKIKGNTVRHNLRDFSYADSKICVKPTNVKTESRYQKKDETKRDDDDFMRTNNSYEKFLSNRHENRRANWTEKELESKPNEAQGETKVVKRVKNGNNTLVGRLTSKLRPKSDTCYYLATSINS
ncbi:uncharacterized protein LOC115222176 [Argonauta hians]